MPKNVLGPITILDAVDLTENQASAPIHILHLDNIAVQANFTGAPDGTLSVQVSNIPVLLPDGSVRGGDNDDDWITLTTPAAVTVSDDTPAGLDVNQSGFAFMRVIWTNSASAASTGTVRVTAKAL